MAVMVGPHGLLRLTHPTSDAEWTIGDFEGPLTRHEADTKLIDCRRDPLHKPPDHDEVSKSSLLPENRSRLNEPSTFPDFRLGNKGTMDWMLSQNSPIEVGRGQSGDL